MKNDFITNPKEEQEKRYIKNEHLHNMEMDIKIKSTSSILNFFKFWTKLIQKQKGVKTQTW